MKKILFFVCLSLAWCCLKAQNITQYEYWFDNDYSARVSTQIAPSEIFRWQTQISCTDLNAGLHVFNTRFKDAAGNWSETVSQYFFKNTVLQDNKIAAYEYWFDNNYSQRINRQVSPVDTFTMSSMIDVNDLTDGLHVFNLRVKDGEGDCSETVSQYFFKNANLKDNKIVSYEYWFDDDYSQCVSKEVSPAGTFTLSSMVDVNVLSDGLHVFNLRVKDGGGNLSETVSQYFFKNANLKDNKIVAYEYWFDDDYSQCIMQDVSPADTFTLSSTVDAGYLADGMHVFNVRFKDNVDNWSETVSQDFFKNTNNVSVLSVTLDKDSIAMQVNEKDTLTATIYPSDASNQDVVWKSSDTYVATVTDGIVTAISVGNAVVTATTADGNKKAYCNVYVTNSTGIDELENESADVIMFPNPASDFVTIKGAEGKTISVFDLWGRIFLKQEKISEMYNVSISSWAKGTYYVRITGDGIKPCQKKLIKR